MNVLTANQREANRRAMRVKIWSRLARERSLGANHQRSATRAH